MAAEATAIKKYEDQLPTAADAQGFDFSEEVTGEDRITMLRDFALHLRRNQFERTEAEPLIRRMNEERCKPPVTEEMLQAEALSFFTAPKPTATASNGIFTIEAPKKPLNIKFVSSIEESEPEWTISDYIVKNAINILGAPGGIGKTTVECAIAAEVSTGNPCFLSDGRVPFTAKPGRVLFFAGEDSFAHTLKHRLSVNGANDLNIATVEAGDPSFKDIKFNSNSLIEAIESVRPSLVIFDPIQQFIPPDVNMSHRNAIRQCLTPLIGYAEEYDCTFLISVHCNKKETRSARASLSDSSDIWDIARSVIMMGQTEDPGIVYVSHEKCNVAPLAETVLISLEDGKVIPRGRTDRRFEDFNGATYERPAPARNEAKSLILDMLEAGKKKCAEIDSELIAMGISKKTIERAKAELKIEKKIRYTKDGFGSAEWYMCKIDND